MCSVNYIIRKKIRKTKGGKEVKKGLKQNIFIYLN